VSDYLRQPLAFFQLQGLVERMNPKAISKTGKKVPESLLMEESTRPPSKRNYNN